MSFHRKNNRLGLGLALLASAAALGLSGPASAQTGYGAQYREDPGTALSRHLKTLADSPRNLSALTGAAKAALELGDAQAAVTFYARAEEIAPRDGRIKAGIGAAFVAMEQPQPAMRFFEEARGLGAPEGEYASDRGLAYDLLGDPVQAQRDYLLAMRTHDSDELRRRLALSRAISGDRAGAIAAIDPQLRRQDRAAWRVRAFVLALTGDPAGATEAARSVMPQQAAAMQPFFARLPSLRPAERAMAVHFGTLPADNGAGVQTYAGVSATSPSTLTDAGRPSATQPGFGSAVTRRTVSGPVLTQRSQPAPTTQIARRPAAPAVTTGASQTNPLLRRWDDARGISSRETRPVARTQPPASTGSIARGTGSMAQDRASGVFSRSTTAPRVPAVDNLAVPPTAMPDRQIAALVPPPDVPVAQAASTPPIASNITAGPVQGPPAASATDGFDRSVATGSTSSGPEPGGMTEAPSLAPPVRAMPVNTDANSSSSTMASGVQPVSLPGSTPGATSSLNAGSSVAEAPASMPTESESGGLTGLAAMIRALPSTEPVEAKPAAVQAQAKGGSADAGAPSRHWVQIAGAADKTSLRGEFARLKGKAPKLLSDKTAWTAPLRYTNRLLVGPFTSAGQAQAFVNELAKATLSAFSWTSAAGQAVERLTGK